jgi:aminopeptidase YwaD
MRFLVGFLAMAALAAPALASSAPAASAKAQPALKVCEDCVRAHMQVLAGEAMRGRQCGTADEANAARFIRSELMRAGAKGAFAGDGYLQPVTLTTPQLAEAPRFTAAKLSWTHGKEFLVLARPQSFSGPLVRVTDPAHPPRDLRGAVVFYDAEKPTPAESKALFAAGATAVIQVAIPLFIEHWADLADEWRQTKVGDAEGNPSTETGARLMLKPEAATALRAIPDGATVGMTARLGPDEVRTTQNVVGVIHGSAPDAEARAILLSAHYDHLGVRGGVLFPGADDDASGTAAVMEFARLLGQGTAPKRTVYFALFGCEEEGGLGATYFRAHPPTKLSDLSANLEFEMIGLRDPKYPDELMLTGWERSNLGPTLAQHGARLGPDRYPEENFFQRSDNYQLALKGVVAQTVGGWPIPPTYHRPTDTLASVDIHFMAEVIQSMAEPVRWLVDGDFTPQWNPGQKP